ncbi:MerR family DNA-binding transcriptional regulator [Pseudomonas sp. Y24-6]|nr:MerR family DNA-binding transcriptional regulator [Pseudomonas sp. Y24-6]
MKVLAAIRSREMNRGHLHGRRLAKATQTKAVTIRYYEAVGLIPPVGRSPSGYRYYADQERERLLFIRVNPCVLPR